MRRQKNMVLLGFCKLFPYGHKKKATVFLKLQLDNRYIYCRKFGPSRFGGVAEFRRIFKVDFSYF